MERNYESEYRLFELVRTTICYQYFYNKTYSKVEKYVLTNNGNSKDAENIFRKTTSEFLRKLYIGEYNYMVCDLKYDKVCKLLISMCKETWDKST